MGSLVPRPPLTAMEKHVACFSMAAKKAVRVACSSHGCEKKLRGEAWVQGSLIGADHWWHCTCISLVSQSFVEKLARETKMYKIYLSPSCPARVFE